MIELFFMTAILGFVKNFVKYKRVSFMLFVRTPLICLLIYLLIKDKIADPILWSIILERWILLICKSIKSFIEDDYNKKKEKYKIKYNLIYLNEKK